MKLKKLHLICALMMVCAIGSTALAATATRGVINLPKKGVFEPVGIGVGLFEQISVQGSTVQTGTVIISAISADNAVTNTLITVTCSNGAVVTNLAANTGLYYVAGEKLLRGGTATNGSCRIIVTQ